MAAAAAAATCNILLPRDAIRERGLCRRALSVCPSVCLSRSCIVSKRVIMFSSFSRSDSHTIRVLSIPNVMTVYRRLRFQLEQTRFSTNV